jgi:hypothetical protein
MVEPIVKVLPHSPEEFKSAAKLAEWMGTELNKDGVYLIASGSKVKDLGAGSICLFMKDKKIIGEAIVKEVKPYSGKQQSPVTAKLYERTIYFAPSSVRRYVNPLGFTNIANITGRTLSYRSGGHLLWVEYGKCLSEIAKSGFY